MNNSAYVDFVHHAVAEWLSGLGFAADWTDQGLFRWAMRELAIEYRLASSFGDRLAAQVWLVTPDALEPVFGCQIVRIGGEVGATTGSDVMNDEKQVIVRSQGRWQRQEKGTDQPVVLPETFLATPAHETGEVPRAFKRPANAQDLRRYHWRHLVERAEVGSGGRTHPHILFEWVEESILSASGTAGWPIERCLAADFVVFQMRHDAVFHSQPVLGQTVEITSRLVEVRRLRGTWQNEIRDKAGGRLLVEDFSTGVFLNLSGRPTSPPPGMMEALQNPVD